MLSSWFGLEPIPICSIDLALFSGWGQSPAPIHRPGFGSSPSFAEPARERYTLAPVTPLQILPPPLLLPLFPVQCAPLPAATPPSAASRAPPRPGYGHRRQGPSATYRHGQGGRPTGLTANRVGQGPSIPRMRFLILAAALACTASPALGRMGSHHVLAAVGVDSDGKKHVLGVREGASENAEVTSALLEDLVERGLDPGRRRLFVIDGSQALRKAIEKVFGQRHPIQRCRNHKLRNVLGHLPKDQHPQVKAAFRAAMKLDAKQGEQKLEQLARWLERDHPSASASLREGLSEMFTINRLGLPPRLRKCLGSTNLIDSTHSGVRQKTRRVTHWKNGAMALRWAAASFVETEKSYRRIIGYDQLWMLRAHLDDHEPVAEMREAG